MRLLATIAEFERARIGERVRAGLAHARANGQRLGQKPQHIPAEALERTAHLSVRHAAAQLGISRSVLHRARLSRRPTEMGVKGTNETGHRSVPLSASRGELFEGQLYTPKRPREVAHGITHPGLRLLLARPSISDYGEAGAEQEPASTTLPLLKCRQ